METVQRIKNKFVFVTTEKEKDESGVFVENTCFEKNAKSLKHIKNYQRRYMSYARLLRSEDKNWIEIYVKRRGIYRYTVTADCVLGFTKKEQLRFTGEASSKIEKWLQNVKHKTDCIFNSETGDDIIYASLSSWRDAVKFSEFLSNLDKSNYYEIRKRM